MLSLVLSKHFTCNISPPRPASFNPLQMRKPSLREVKYLDQSHKPGKWLSQHLAPGLLRTVSRPGPLVDMRQRGLYFRRFPTLPSDHMQSNSGALCDARNGGKHKEKLGIPLYGDSQPCGLVSRTAEKSGQGACCLCSG